MTKPKRHTLFVDRHLLGAALLLSGCHATVAPLEEAESVDAEPQETAAPVLPYPERPPEPPRLSAEAPDTLTASTAPAEGGDIAPVLKSAIIGESEDGIRSIFGDPETIVPKFPGHVWNYGSETCEMNIFFYLDITTNTFRVLTLDVSPTSEAESCYGRLSNAKS